MQKTAVYRAENTYDTLNKITNKTKNVWLVLHGIGYLSRYFIKHFEYLNPEENYIICPQAPSKYYKDTNYKRVGACWLTKENTAIDTENILNYVDSIIENENLSTNLNFIVLCYSQGVSVGTRWLANRKRNCDTLVMISGGFPKELSAVDFSHLDNLNVFHTVGEKDPLFKRKNVLKQEEHIQNLFPNVALVNHNGGHELDISLLKQYI